MNIGEVMTSIMGDKRLVFISRDKESIIKWDEIQGCPVKITGNKKLLLTINSEVMRKNWEPLAIRVSFKDAFYALRYEGKDIYCVFDKVRYDFKENYKGTHKINEDFIDGGEWYIEDSESVDNKNILINMLKDIDSFSINTQYTEISDNCTIEIKIPICELFIKGNVKNWGRLHEDNL
jgi:hypothetical protein